MDMKTELGEKVQELLLRGEAVPEDIVITMIENKINSPEVAHHGKRKIFCIVHFLETKMTYIKTLTFLMVHCIF